MPSFCEEQMTQDAQKVANIERFERILSETFGGGAAFFSYMWCMNSYISIWEIWKSYMWKNQRCMIFTKKKREIYISILVFRVRMSEIQENERDLDFKT